MATILFEAGYKAAIEKGELAKPFRIFFWALARFLMVIKGLHYGYKRIVDNALVALTLMIAESKPDEKDTMVKVVVNLINNRN